MISYILNIYLIFAIMAHDSFPKSGRKYQSRNACISAGRCICGLKTACQVDLRISDATCTSINWWGRIEGKETIAMWREEWEWDWRREGREDTIGVVFNNGLRVRKSWRRDLRARRPLLNITPIVIVRLPNIYHQRWLQGFPVTIFLFTTITTLRCIWLGLTKSGVPWWRRHFVQGMLFAFPPQNSSTAKRGGTFQTAPHPEPPPSLPSALVMVLNRSACRVYASQHWNGHYSSHQYG